MIYIISRRRVKGRKPFLPLPLPFCFKDGSLDWARGRWRASRKHRPGNPLFSTNPKGVRKERRKACGSARPLKRPAPRGSGKRATFPAPFPALGNGGLPCLLEKMKAAEFPLILSKRFISFEESFAHPDLGPPLFPGRPGGG